MANVGEINKLMKDIMGNFPFDNVVLVKAFKNSSVLKEKVLNGAVEAAGKSIEMSTYWAKTTLGKLHERDVAKDGTAD